MSARELITEHLDLWTGAVTKKSSRGRGGNGKVELTGVKRLRELILELAVRGMLVEQSAAEAPASVLLDDILVERKRLANEGHIRGQKCPPATELNRLPAKLPDGWAGATLSHLGVFSGGKTPSKSRSVFWNGDIPWVTPKDMKSAEISASEDHVTQDALNAGGLALLPENAVLFVVRSGILRRMFPTAVTRVHCTVNQDLKALRLFKPEMARYIQVLSWGFERFILEKLTKTGTTVESLKFSDFANQPFPLPPLEEQHRIVQKVDELMALCDRLEQQTSDQLEAHETLVDTLLCTLTQSENATELTDNWVRLAAHFDTLLTTEQSIDKLKQTILQLAVMGRLVEQDAGDEPANVLLNRIEKDKNRLAAEGKIKKGKRLLEVRKDEMPFDIPRSWQWTRIQHVSEFITSGSRDWAKYYSDSGAIFITMGNLSRGHYRLRLENIRHVSPPTGSEGARTSLQAGDIVVSITGDVGNLGLIPEGFGEAYINQHSCLVRFSSLCRNRYFAEFLRSPCAKAQFDKPQRGIKNSFRLSDMGEMTVPLPPLQEQHRIVQKVDELMTLCDQLKERLNQASETRGQLAEAVVEGALSE